MTPQDRALARDLLLQNRLTIEQVTDIQRECEASGRGFAQVAAERGWLPPAEPARTTPSSGPGPAPSLRSASSTSPLFQRLLVVTLGLLAVLVAVGLLELRRRNERDRELAQETLRAMTDADRRAAEVRLAYERDSLKRQEAEFQAALKKARDLMARAEERTKVDPSDPQIHLGVVEATVQFNTYLAGHETDAGVLLERSRAYELRRDFERAIRDVDRAIELKKELAPVVDARLQELRLQLARPKK
jgi:hypothetical protein